MESSWNANNKPSITFSNMAYQYDKKPDDSTVINWDTYGIDYESSAHPIETNNNIVVPNSGIELNEEELNYFKQMVDPTQNDGNNGIEHYLNTVDIVSSFVHE